MQGGNLDTYGERQKREFYAQHRVHGGVRVRISTRRMRGRRMKTEIKNDARDLQEALSSIEFEEDSLP